MKALSYAQINWRPLLSYGDYARLTEVLSDEADECYMHGVASCIERRVAADTLGSAFTLVAEDHGAPLGWAGVLDYPARPGCVQSSTFLAPAARGTGLNLKAKTLLCTIAALLGDAPLLLSIDQFNSRSQSAALKLFPEVEIELAMEPWDPSEVSHLFPVHGLPLGGQPLAASELSKLATLIAGSPFGACHPLLSRSESNPSTQKRRG